MTATEEHDEVSSPAAGAVGRTTPGAREIAAALEEALAVLTDGDGPARTSSRLSTVFRDLASSALVKRLYFKLALVENSPTRSRFVAEVLSREGERWMARFLAEQALESTMQPWQRRRLGELKSAQVTSPQPIGQRHAHLLELSSDGVRSRGRGTDHVSAAHSPDGAWLEELVSDLETEGVGIHRDALILEVAEDAEWADLERILLVARLLPVTPAVVLNSVDHGVRLLTAADAAHLRDVRPLVVHRDAEGVLSLLSSGGGALEDVEASGALHGDSLASSTAALGLLEVVTAPALASHRTAVVGAFRNENSELFPLQSAGGAIDRALRFRGTPRGTAPLRLELGGLLVKVGFFEEAYSVLNGVPGPSRSRAHAVHLGRARFGTARFEELLDTGLRAKPYESERAEFAEAEAAMTLLRRLDQVVDHPEEKIESVDRRILSILHASEPDQSGGYAVRAHSVLVQLAAHGFDVVPYTRPGFPDGVLDLAPGETTVVPHGGIDYRRIGTSSQRADGEYGYMLESLDRYLEVIRREKPSVVHLRSTYVSALPGLIAAKHFGLPVVYEVSGMWELVYEAANAARMEGRRARTVRLENAVLAAADSVATLTSAMGDIIQERVALRRPVRIVPNAVEVGTFHELEKDESLLSELGWPPEVPVIGYVGSFVQYEGLDILLRALAALRDRGLQYRALLVGDGAESARLRDLAASLGLSDAHVHFTGRVPHENVARYYSLVDVCAYPRRLTPATVAVSPLKPFEALASRKAVLVSDVPALVEIAGGGDRARVFASGSVEGLAEALEETLVRPETTEAMRERGQRWVQEERSWAAVGQAFSAQIEEALHDAVGAADER